MDFKQTWRNRLWKSVDLLPVAHRLRARCALIRLRISHFETEWHKLAILGPNHGLALDIGANRGFYSFELARYYERVIAFEPNLQITNELMACRLPTVEVVHSGLSDSCGVRRLHLPIDSDGSHLDGWGSFDPDNLPGCNKTTENDVSTVTLDSMDLKGVTFIKLDVEGHEIEVARGALHLFRRDHPTILAELRPANVDLFTELMKDVGLIPLPRIDGATSDMHMFGARPDHSDRCSKDHE